MRDAAMAAVRNAAEAAMRGLQPGYGVVLVL
jgi:hypothetical protein